MVRSVALVSLVVLAGCGQESTPQRPVLAGSGSGSAVVPAPAATGPIALAAAARGGMLELTLTNTSASQVTIASHVIGGTLRHYDWLAVELESGGVTRTVHFVGARDESGVITADLDPGESITERIDLVRWAIAAPGGGPLVPGTYRVRATWDTTGQTRGVTVVATATTTMVIDPPGAAPCDVAGYKPPPGATLILLARQAPTGRATVDVGLHNAGDVAVCVYSHVATHERQNDWLTIQYSDGAKYHHGSRVIRLDDDRDRSAPISVLLGPGQTIWQPVDVDQWALRTRNGKEPVPAGSLYAQAAWDSTQETRVWAGTLLSDPFELLVE